MSRYKEEPKSTHWNKTDSSLHPRYVITWIMALLILINDFALVGYSDSDWSGDMDDRKSTSAGYVFDMGDMAFTWLSKKQPIVTLSTCEAEENKEGGCWKINNIEIGICKLGVHMRKKRF